jgi:hypothetical protein
LQGENIMLRKLFILLLVGAVGASFLWAAPEKAIRPQKASHSLPVIGGVHDPNVNVQVAPWRPSRHTLDEHIGITDTAGTTYYDYQHNGTAGKMIAVDALGMVSVVWMNGLYPDPAQTRQVFYNVWDPLSANFIFDTVGIRIDAAPRAGYVCQVTDANGFCYPAFHQTGGGGEPHAAAAGDYAAYSDAFTSWEPDWCYDGTQDLQLIWPKIAMDINGVLHMVSTESPLSGVAGDPQRIYYSRGIPEFDEYGFFLDILWDDMDCGGFQVFDTVMVIAPVVAASRHTDRIAIVWSHSKDDLLNNPSQYNNDIYLMVSEDGGLNWGDKINVTQWTDPDPVCLYETHDTLACNRDTMRAYTDCSILFDENDNIHVAFTVGAFWWYYPGETDTGWINAAISKIYHWSEATHCYSEVADGWRPSYDPGAWQRTAQRPSLALDPSNGYLYCSYMFYDTLTYSEGGYPLSDAFVTVSTDGGTNWAVGTNVTNTTPDVIPVPTGESENERDITLAPLVSDGFLHMEYIFDKDAGGIPQDEGIATVNPVIYQRIPVSEIPTTPLMEHYPMHWDSTGFCTGSTAQVTHSLPEYFALYQNYPNPFNPSTMLQFDLGRSAKVTLKVYNVLGQEVVTLLNDTPLSAGAHQVEFDGSHLPSGVYIYSLISDGYSASKKMVLMK